VEQPVAALDGEISRSRFFHLSAVATAAYTLLLLCATHYPKPEQLLGPHAPSDKTLHFLAYGGLGLLAAATLATSGRWSMTRALILGAGLAAFGAADEITQPWFQRAAEPLDWVCDCLGIAAGIVVVALIVAISQRRHRPADDGQ
jgi:VanZ family protein